MYGGNKASDFERFGGSNSALIFVNEATILHKQTLEEVFKRLRCGQETIIFDTNPDHPEHYFKTDYIDNINTFTTYNFTTYDNVLLSKRFIETQEKLHEDIPTYKERILLDVYLFEKIYVEIEKRIENHNFLFYKDESLVQLQDALSSVITSLSALTQSSSDKGIGILSGFFKKQNSNNHSKDISNLRSLNDSLSNELARLKNNLNNEGIFYTATPSASLEVVKYDLSYLKEALELIKAKIGADTKEPLTRSFNEQAKGLGNDGKGDRSNY